MGRFYLTGDRLPRALLDAARVHGWLCLPPWSARPDDAAEQEGGWQRHGEPVKHVTGVSIPAPPLAALLVREHDSTCRLGFAPRTGRVARGPIMSDGRFMALALPREIGQALGSGTMQGSQPVIVALGLADAHQADPRRSRATTRERAACSQNGGNHPAAHPLMRA